MPVPYPYLVGKENKILNPKKTQAILADRVEYTTASSLDHPTLNSAIPQKERIQFAKDHYRYRKQPPLAQKWAALASNAINVRKDKQIYHDLESVTPQPPKAFKKIGKQIDPKWKESLAIAPPQYDEFETRYKQPFMPPSPGTMWKMDQPLSPFSVSHHNSSILPILY